MKKRNVILLFVFALIALLAGSVATVWEQRPDAACLGAVVALAVGAAAEMYFRGWPEDHAADPWEWLACIAGSILGALAVGAFL